MDGKTAALETELADVQAQLRAAEQDGAEIAALAEQTITELRLEIARLKKGDAQDSGVFCQSCQRKREVIAGFIGAIFLGLWFHFLPWGTAETWQNRLGIALGFAPLLKVEIPWLWLLFKRKYW